MANNKKRMYEMHAEICKALSHPRRLEVLDRLREGEKSVEELSRLMEMPKSNLSQHLAILRQMRLVKTRREGLNIIYSIANEKIIEACDTVSEVLLSNLTQNEDIAAMLKNQDSSDPK
ncbi:MAG TPA: winged helix-turn-helix transcriptional regulator [Firmicutes bacterium]|nr:winged helix-turn-helix transcriptional regulator [Bacillota bacterium]